MDDSARRRWTTVALRWMAAVTLVVLVGRLGGVGSAHVRAAVPVLAGVDPVAVAAVVGLEIVWVVALAQTSRNAVLALGGRLRLVQALRISMAGFTLSRVVPGGGAAGGVFSLRELHRLGHPAALAASATVASWATSVAALGALLVGGLAVATVAPGGLPPASLPSAAAVLTLALAGAVVLAVLRRDGVRLAVAARLDRLRCRLPAGWRPRWSLGSVTACDPAALRRSLAWGGLAWTVDIAAMGAAFAVCGRPLTPGVLLLGYVAATLLNSAPELTPGWLGVFEAAQAATFTSLGVDAATAVAGVVLYRLLSFWLPTAAGVVPLVISLRRPRPAVPARIDGTLEAAA